MLLNNLADDLLLDIFKKLNSIKTVYNLRLVNKRFKQLVDLEPVIGSAKKVDAWFLGNKRSVVNVYKYIIIQQLKLSEFNINDIFKKSILEVSLYEDHNFEKINLFPNLQFLFITHITDEVIIEHDLKVKSLTIDNKVKIKSEQSYIEDLIVQSVEFPDISKFKVIKNLTIESKNFNSEIMNTLPKLKTININGFINDDKNVKKYNTDKLFVKKYNIDITKCMDVKILTVHYSKISNYSFLNNLVKLSIYGLFVDKNFTISNMPSLEILEINNYRIVNDPYTIFLENLPKLLKVDIYNSNNVTINEIPKTVKYLKLSDIKIESILCEHLINMQLININLMSTVIETKIIDLLELTQTSKVFINQIQVSTIIYSSCCELYILADRAKKYKKTKAILTQKEGFKCKLILKANNLKANNLKAKIDNINYNIKKCECCY